MFKLIINIILFILSIVLIVVTFIMNIIYLFLLPDRIENFSNMFFSLAFGNDQTGNGAFPYLLNFLFVKETKLSCEDFGNSDETISSVLGRLKKYKNLTEFGKDIAWFLNILDKNHVEDAIGNLTFKK